MENSTAVCYYCYFLMEKPTLKISRNDDNFLEFIRNMCVQRLTLETESRDVTKSKQFIRRLHHLDCPPLYSIRFYFIFLSLFFSLVWKYTCHAHVENIQSYTTIKAKFIAFSHYSSSMCSLSYKKQLQKLLTWLGLSTFFVITVVIIIDFVSCIAAQFCLWNRFISFINRVYYSVCYNYN